MPSSRVQEQFVFQAKSRRSPGKSTGNSCMPVAHGNWGDLALLDEDRRTALRRYAGLGLLPIAIHGVRADGSCSCSRGNGCPKKTRGKHPVSRHWQSGDLDVSLVERQLADNPIRNIGLRMGRQPDGRFLVAVDVDGPRELLRALEDEHGPFPDTLTARTGSGGLHLLYWIEGREVGNRVGIVPRVDVRGASGQIVVAPSTHYTGQTYQWIHVREPAVLP